MTNIQNITKQLSIRIPRDNLRQINDGGIYALYLKQGPAIGNFHVNSDGLFYIGLSSCLSLRDIGTHFSSGGTGFSTVRRSLGAILKDKLDLNAIPRGNGPSKLNCRNYKFKANEEEKLTAWINDNIDIGICIVDNIKSVEKNLIAKLRPVLNLTGWDNPFRADIKKLRKLCVCEAIRNQTRA
jgi:hypothetical protein